MARSDAGRQERHLRLWQWLLLIVLGILIILTIQIVYAYWVLNFAKFGDTDMTPRGQFGDIFGGVNAFFTGAAFAGLIITILLQRSELVLQREQLQEQAAGQRESTTALLNLARSSLITTLVDGYTNEVAIAEQGNFRGQLWRADYRLRSWAKEEEVAELLGDEEGKYIEMMIDRYIAEHPREREDEEGSFRNPVFRSSYVAWKHARKRRAYFLKILEGMREEVDASVGQRVTREDKRPSTPNT